MIMIFVVYNLSVIQIIDKVLQNFHYLFSLRDFEGALLYVLVKITCLLASVENSHDSLCLSSGELLEHYCCISHTIITLLLFITSILAFSQEIIIGYHTFLLDITYSHYCAFLNCASHSSKEEATFC